MGSATREALASSKAALAALGGTADLAVGPDLFAVGTDLFAVGTDLFAVGVVLGDSASLRAAIADPAAQAAEKAPLIDTLFGAGISGDAIEVLKAVAANRWSSQSDLLAALEELGIRAVAASAEASVSIESELFAFGQAVSSDPELELALGSKLGDTSSKLSLIQRLLADKVSPQTLAIVRHVVGQPRGRRIRKLIQHATSVVADVAGLAVATVTSAVPLATGQYDRLQAKLAVQYGRKLQLNIVIDPSVVGGLRVQVGDDVIDGSIASRINDLKLQLQR